MCILQSLVGSQKAHKKPLYACYIDFTKAFDYENRDVLVFKLKKRFVDGKFLSVIKSMFNKSNGRVKWRNKFSKPIKGKFGVLQGGVLSPKLFTEFLCDISEYLDRSLGVKLGDMVIMYLLFADDMCFFRIQPKDYRSRSHYFGATVDYGN